MGLRKCGQEFRLVPKALVGLCRDLSEKSFQDKTFLKPVRKIAATSQHLSEDENDDEYEYEPRSPTPRKEP